MCQFMEKNGKVQEELKPEEIQQEMPDFGIRIRRDQDYPDWAKEDVNPEEALQKTSGQSRLAIGAAISLKEWHTVPRECLAGKRVKPANLALTSAHRRIGRS